MEGQWKGGENAVEKQWKTAQSRGEAVESELTESIDCQSPRVPSEGDAGHDSATIAEAKALSYPDEWD